MSRTGRRTHRTGPVGLAGPLAGPGRPLAAVTGAVPAWRQGGRLPGTGNARGACTRAGWRQGSTTDGFRCRDPAVPGRAGNRTGERGIHPRGRHGRRGAARKGPSGSARPGRPPATGRAGRGAGTGTGLRTRGRAPEPVFVHGNGRRTRCSYAGTGTGTRRRAPCGERAREPAAVRGNGARNRPPYGGRTPEPVARAGAAGTAAESGARGSGTGTGGRASIADTETPGPVTGSEVAARTPQLRYSRGRLPWLSSARSSRPS